MVFVAVLLGVAVLGGLAVWALRRRGSDEMHSVAGYQERLERLEELRRRQGGSVRVVGSTAPRGEPDHQPVIGESGRIEISSSTSRHRGLDDGAGTQEPGNRPPPPVYRRSRDTSIARMSHRPRRLGAPIAAAVAVIALVTGLAIAGAHSRPPHSTTATTIKKGHGRTSKPTHPTTTTTAVPPSFSPSSTSGTDVTYSLPFSSYTITFRAATGACYVQITNSSGTTPYAQVLNQWSTEQIVLSGTSKVTLGAPSDITIEVDRTPVTFPTPLPAPMNITFEGAPPPPTTPTT
jgi:uncharacterized iron-regulated membrane protein